MIWRSLRTAAWLGWQIESNWTDPFLFAIYSIIKPLTSAGILVVMYAMVTKSNFASTANARGAAPGTRLHCMGALVGTSTASHNRAG